MMTSRQLQTRRIVGDGCTLSRDGAITVQDRLQQLGMIFTHEHDAVTPSTTVINYPYPTTQQYRDGSKISKRYPGLLQYIPFRFHPWTGNSLFYPSAANSSDVGSTKAGKRHLNKKWLAVILTIFAVLSLLAATSFLVDHFTRNVQQDRTLYGTLRLKGLNYGPEYNNMTSNEAVNLSTILCDWLMNDIVLGVNNTAVEFKSCLITSYRSGSLLAAFRIGLIVTARNQSEITNMCTLVYDDVLQGLNSIKRLQQLPGVEMCVTYLDFEEHTDSICDVTMTTTGESHKKQTATESTITTAQTTIMETESAAKDIETTRLQGEKQHKTEESITTTTEATVIVTETTTGKEEKAPPTVGYFGTTQEATERTTGMREKEHTTRINGTTTPQATPNETETTTGKEEEEHTTTGFVTRSQETTNVETERTTGEDEKENTRMDVITTSEATYIKTETATGKEEKEHETTGYFLTTPEGATIEMETTTIREEKEHPTTRYDITTTETTCIEIERTTGEKENASLTTNHDTTTQETTTSTEEFYSATTSIMASSSVIEESPPTTLSPELTTTVPCSSNPCPDGITCVNVGNDFFCQCQVCGCYADLVDKTCGTLPSNITGSCTDLGDGFFPVITDCTKYKWCFSGGEAIQSCAPGTVFQRHSLMCSFANDCSVNVTLKPPVEGT